MKNGSDALRLLKKDHKKVKSLLEELTGTTSRATKKRTSLLEEIGRELRVHARIEEEIFYPAVREAAENKGDEAMIAEAYEEHRVVEQFVLPDLEDTAPTGIEFGGRAKVLRELVEHHADEEESDLFERVKKLLSQDELRDLGARMMERKEALLEQLAG